MFDYKSELAKLHAKLALMKANLLEKDEMIMEMLFDLKEIRLSLAQRCVWELAGIGAACERAHQS